MMQNHWGFPRTNSSLFSSVEVIWTKRRSLVFLLDDSGLHNPTSRDNNAWRVCVLHPPLPTQHSVTLPLWWKLRKCISCICGQRAARGKWLSSSALPINHYLIEMNSASTTNRRYLCMTKQIVLPFMNKCPPCLQTTAPSLVRNQQMALRNNNTFNQSF